MSVDRSRTSLASVFVAATALASMFAIWAASPFDGELNLLAGAITAAFVVAFLTPFGAIAGMATAVAAIVISLLFFITPDTSGLGPPGVTIPIQLFVGAVPIGVSGVLGQASRSWLSRSAN